MSDEEFVLQETTAGIDPETGEKIVYEKIPDGTFVEAEVVAVKKEPHKFFKEEDGSPQIKVNFRFKILEGEFVNRQVFGMTPTTFTTHDDCKLRQWVEALLGVDEIAPGFKFTLGDLVSTKARIVIGLREYVDKEGKDGWNNEVRDVIFSRENEERLARQRAAAPAPQPVTVPAGPEEEPF